jgi:pyruvate kinase
MKKTKIICTMGPTTDKEGLLSEMLKAGMDMARFNFSHGDHSEQAKRIALVRQAAKEVGKPVAIIADTKGPEMRLGIFKAGKVELTDGSDFCLTTEDIEGDEKTSSVNYGGLPAELSVGDQVLLNDGKLTLEVIKLEPTKIHTKIIHGGEISSRKRVAVPGIKLKLPFISPQDEADINFAIDHDMDYIAASFVQTQEDIIEIRKLLEAKNSTMGIIAKIESRDGVNNIDEILQVADGIMVARGDLGVEIPYEEVPLVQKAIITKCNKVGKPVITATQMLESMISNYRATRAEASDVANSIFDGTDVIMLSGETASGEYPLEAVQTMAKIAIRTEESLDYVKIFRNKGIGAQVNMTDAISHATVQVAQELEADAILTITESGYTARMIAKYRPQATVIAVSPVDASIRRMQMYWGVKPLLGVQAHGTDELIELSLGIAQEKKMLMKGDSVVVTAGMNVGKVGSTNLIKVINLGTKVVHGVGIGKNAVTGTVCKVNGVEDLAKFKPGDIMLVSSVENEIAPYASKALGIIAEEGGFTSSAAIIGINCGVPVIVGATGAMEKLTDGQEVTLDVSSGSIYDGRINIK